MTDIQSKYQFASIENNFGLTIFAPEIRIMLEYCCNSSGAETGGILIGRYSQEHNMAIVTRISGPPKDSKSGSFFFVRGIKGLQSMLNRLWRRNEYYIGEWHFHPYAAPIPSSTDHKQMIEFSRDKNMKCPEPILLIIGGDPKVDWFMKVIVYPKCQDALDLIVTS